MLTDAQKAAIRLLIRDNPDPRYMAHLANDDTFAIKEIGEYKDKMLPAFQQRLQSEQAELQHLQDKMIVTQADIQILQGV